MWDIMSLISSRTSVLYVWILLKYFVLDLFAFCSIKSVIKNTLFWIHLVMILEYLKSIWKIFSWIYLNLTFNEEDWNCAIYVSAGFYQNPTRFFGWIVVVIQGDDSPCLKNISGLRILFPLSLCFCL